MLILLLQIDGHFLMRVSMSKFNAISLLSVMHIKSLNLSEVRDDLSFVHMRFIAENALSTLAEDVDRVFFTLISFIRFSIPLLRIGKPREISYFAFLASVFNKVLLTFKQSKWSTIYRRFSKSKKFSDAASNASQAFKILTFLSSNRTLNSSSNLA